MSDEGRSTVEPGFIHRQLKFPILEREDRVALAERVSNSSSADADFIMMMTLAAVLASLGLMQGSTEVVIGAMLVAPLCLWLSSCCCTAANKPKALSVASGDWGHLRCLTIPHLARYSPWSELTKTVGICHRLTYLGAF